MPKRADRRPKAEPTVTLAEVEDGQRVRLEAIVLGGGGFIGRRVRVGEWTGPLPVSVPVEPLADE